MKKLLLSIVALLGVMNASAQTTADVSASNDAIYAVGGTYVIGKEIKLPICSKSSIDAQACTFYVTLQEGLSFVADPNDAGSIKAEMLNSANHSVMNNITSGMFAIFSTKNLAMPEDLMYIYLTTPANLAPGEYTIKIDKIETSNADTNKDVNVKESFVSTIVLNNYLILDETSTEAPEAMEDVDVHVKRTIKANEWSTICLPFAMTDAQVKSAFGDDVELGDFKGYTMPDDESISVSFDAATAIEANHPYIIKVASAISEFNVEGVDIAPDEDLTIAAVKRTKKAWSEMTGTYVAGTVLEENTLFLNDNKFWYSTGSTKMKAFRAYFDFYDELENKDAANNVKISFDDATGIKNIQASENAPFYTLDGKLMGKNMNRLPKGVYIQNGKKVVK